MRPLRFSLLPMVACVLLCSAAAMAQQFAPAVRIVNHIDESQLVTLKGNTHPAANVKNDQGLVSPSLPMTDLILVLSRDPAQQAAFDKFVASQYDPNSPDFHQWLTPEQVGTNFGPSETDIATVTNWLTGHGFTVSQVTKDHMSIRFSGTASQVQSTFHTEIHNLSVKGVAHIGNMSDPQIPAALGSVVVGVKALHNFFPRPLHHRGSQVTKDSATGKWQRNANGLTIASKQSGAVQPAMTTAGSRTPRPQFTINVPASGGTAGTPAFTEEDLSPYDFATIYNVLPLWKEGIDGTGQTIAIAGTSDISQSDVANFRTFFNLPTNIPANTPKIVHPNPSLPGGDDPGICTAPTTDTSAPCTIDDLVENSLDVEWSGSVAKNAQIVLVTAASQSSSDDTLYDAESYIVENVTAHIVSVSYGNCELFMGTSGNAQYNTLWQNAASEGIAVFVAAGDSGSASCDASLSTGPPWVAEDGLSVSGLASTPYDTAVGGTDFNWCPFLTAFNGNTCPSQPYWNTSNTANSAGASSASGYVPEMPWNETCTNPFMLQGLITLAGPNYLNVSGVNNTEEACNLISDNLNTLEANYPYSVGLLNTVGGGGGASGCTTSDGSDVSSCAGGYAKPSWQAGVTGIPSDGKRDLPDVSFFAADGYVSDSAYLICVEENGGQPCTYSADAEPFASEVGGTSASTPPMAGVMALIDQKMGAAQGFANPELYKLAAAQTYSSCSAETVTAGSTTCMFNDIDAGPFASAGTIAMPCDSGADFPLVSPNCVVKDSLEGFSDEVGILSTSTGPGYNAGTGYDLATGLGSLNVANVVNAWTAVTGLLTPTVTVTPSPNTLPSSQSLSVTGTVTGTGATPTGTVTLMAGTYTSPATALSSTGTYSFTVPAGSLSAGTNTLSVAYSGNPTYNPANGTATVTVTGTGTAASFSLITPAIVVTPAGGVAPGASANAAVTVSAVNGYAGTVELTCSELSSTSSNSATDAPNCTGGGSGHTVTLPTGTTQVVNFTVTTTAPSTTTIGLAKPTPGGRHSGWASGGAVLAFLLFLGIPARRRSWRSMVGMLMLMAALASLSSCGTGGGSGTTTNNDPGTSAGTYTFTVTGVGNPSVSPTSSTSTTFTVTVN
jgi:subtilase family serine protease